MSDASTDAFLNTLKRFISRRGKSTHIHTDDWQNFLAANNQLKSLASLLSGDGFYREVWNFSARRSIEWSFVIEEPMIAIARDYMLDINGSDINVNRKKMSSIFFSRENLRAKSSLNLLINLLQDSWASSDICPIFKNKELAIFTPWNKTFCTKVDM